MNMGITQGLFLYVLVLVCLSPGSESASVFFVRNPKENPCLRDLCDSTSKVTKEGIIITIHPRGWKSSFRILKMSKDDLDYEKMQQVFLLGEPRYKSTFQRVFGFGGTFKKNEKNESRIIHGKILLIGDDVKSAKPKIDLQTAFKLAVEHEKKKLKIINMETHPSEVPKRQPLIIYFDAKEEKAKLSHRFKFLVHDNETNYFTTAYVIVDAKTGNIIDSFERLLTAYTTMTGVGGNPGTGQYIFGQGKYENRTLNVNKTGDVCTPENKHVTVASSRGKPFFFPPNQCFDPLLNDAFEEECDPKPPNKDQTNNSFSQVHDGLYFATNFIETLAGKNFKDKTLETKCKKRMRTCVHFPDTISFYAGTIGFDECEVYFGIGNDKFYDMASASVIGHEVAHALVTLNSDLEPKCESGAIHEAFCDLSGVVSKASTNNFKQPDWNFGSEIVKQQGGAIRFMNDPPKDNISIDHVDNHNCNMDIHHGAGIYNKAITILAESNRWNLIKTYKLFLLANRMFWTETNTFNEGVCGLLNAAKILKFSIKEITDAFAAVGVSCDKVPPPPTTTTTTTPPPTPAPCKHQKLKGKCLPEKKCKTKKFVRCPLISPCDGKKLCCFPKKKMKNPPEECSSSSP